MRLDIRTQNIEKKEDLQSQVQNRLHLALDRFRSKIASVVVRVTDLNGYKGGVDKQCKIAAHLHPSGSIIVESSDSDVRVAFDRAADRLSRSVRRHFSRRNHFERSRAGDIPWTMEQTGDAVS